MTAQPIWSAGTRSTGFRAEVGARDGDELEVELSRYDGGRLGMSIVHVLSRRDVADLADALYRWLRESPPGRGGVIVDPREFAALERALHAAGRLTCDREGCGHPMDFHGIGTKVDRPTPCGACLCPRFR